MGRPSVLSNKKGAVGIRKYIVADSAVWFLRGRQSGREVSGAFSASSVAGVLP